MESRRSAGLLTPREREIAGLIARGLTNRQIAIELSISERTVEAHVQNIFNKLGASNRAQVAAWSERDRVDMSWSAPASAASVATVAKAPAPAAIATRKRSVTAWLAALIATAAVLMTASGGGQRTMTTGGRPILMGPAVYQARLAGDGEGFGIRYVIGDPDASAIRFPKGSVEFAILKANGNTGNNLGMPVMRRYYAEARLAVQPGSNVEFWIDLDSNGASSQIGDHLIDIQTASELVQLQYQDFVNNAGGLALGPQVLVPGLQSGREFTLAALVDPPRYQVFLDGRSVINLAHSPSAQALRVSFAIFGEGGLVRLTSMQVYRLG